MKGLDYTITVENPKGKVELKFGAFKTYEIMSNLFQRLKAQYPSKTVKLFGKDEKQVLAMYSPEEGLRL